MCKAYSLNWVQMFKFLDVYPDAVNCQPRSKHDPNVRRWPCIFQAAKVELKISNSLFAVEHGITAGWLGSYMHNDVCTFKLC